MAAQEPKHLMTGYEVGVQGVQILLTLQFGTGPGLEDGPVVRMPMFPDQAERIAMDLLKCVRLMPKPSGNPKH